MNNRTKLKLNKVDNNLQFKTQMQSTNENNSRISYNIENKNFNIKVNSSDNEYINTDFDNTNRTFSPQMEVSTKEKDFWYDLIIYYDGGDVDGYGYDS